MVFLSFNQLFLFRNRLKINHRKIATLFKCVVLVQHISHTARHASREVAPGWANHKNTAACHIFAAVIARAFNDGDSTRVAHREPLTRYTAEISFTRDSTIEHRIAHDDGTLWHKADLLIWLDNDLA